MARKKFTDEQKAAFLALVHEYMDKCWSAGSAYKQVAAEYQQEGKEVPEKNTCYNWLAREKRESGGEGADAANRANLDGPDGQDGLDGQRGNLSGDPRGADADADPEGTAGETPELDDYTHRLEMIVRLYRTRSEAAVDAVCDRLLPELTEE